jgi:hypothetical protein
MDEVEGLEGVTGVEDARDVDLVRALADHLDVHIFLRERCEHTPGDSDHISHLLSYHRQDRHVAMHGHLKRGVSAQATHTAPRGARDREFFALRLVAFLVLTLGEEKRGARGEKKKLHTHDADLLEIAHETGLQLSIEYVLDRHADKDLASADQVHDDAKAVECAEYPREEAVRDALPVRLYVQHDNALFDRHGRRQPLPLSRNRASAVDVCVREHPIDERGTEVGQRIGIRIGLRVDDRAPAARVHDILNANRDFSPDNLSATVQNGVALLHSYEGEKEGSVRACSMVNGWTTSLP